MSQLIRALLVDDEPGSLMTLKTLLQRYCPDVSVVADTGHPPDVVDLVKKFTPDLVFLDIEMPYANAFDLLDMLQPVSFEVIFVTAFNDYALKAFKYAALDYLLKPLNIDELKGAVERVKKVLNRPPGLNDRVKGLLENLNHSSDDPEKISIPTDDGYSLLNLNAIIFIEAVGNYSKIHLENGKKPLIVRSLKEFEELLPTKRFIRVHHSFIINIHHAKRYQKGRGGVVEMTNGVQIEVAVRKRTDFLARFGS
jgi:two-component system, LytTR family, response regulator